MVDYAATQTKLTDKLTENAKSSAGADLAIRTFCHQVLNQPNIEVPSSIIKELPIQTYLEEAKTHANDYIKNINPDMIKVLTDIKSYSTRNMMYGNEINAYLEQWKNSNDKSAKEGIQHLLQRLRTSMNRNKEHVEGVRISLNHFYDRLSEDAANFAKAQKTAEVIIKSDQGRLADVKKTIKSLDDSITGATVAIGLGAFSLLGGIATIGVGLLAELPSGWSSTKVIIGGAALVIGGLTAVGGGTYIIAKSMNEKADFLREQHDLEGILVFLPSIESTMLKLGNQAQVAAVETNNLATSWSLLSNKINYVIESVNDASNPDELPNNVLLDLNLAKSQWTDVENTATKIEDTLINVRTEVLKDSQGNLTTLDHKTIKLLAA